MSTLLYDLQKQGLAGAAIVFTMAEFAAIVCGPILIGTPLTEAGFSRGQSNAAAGVFWLICLVLTWRYLYRARKSSSETSVSTSLFHTFQFVTIAVCLGYAVLSGGLQSKSLLWAGLGIEVTVAVFYINYVFLGFTLRYKMPLSSIPGLLIAFGSVWFSTHHLPTL